MRSLSLFYALSGLIALGSLAIIVFVLDKKSPRAADRFRHPALFRQFLPRRAHRESCSPIAGKPDPAVQGVLQLVAMIASIVLVSVVEAHPAASFLAPLTFSVFLGSLLAFPERCWCRGCW